MTDATVTPEGDPSLPGVVGIDLGGTKILGRRIDPITGASSGRVKAKTPRTGLGDVIDALVEVIGQVDPDGTATAIGVGVPGLVDVDGVVAQCPNIVGWDDPLALGPILAERLGRPVVIGNDVNCGALGEHRLGAGRGHGDLLAVFVGTGVGGGIVLDDRIRAGRRGLGGEIGHMTIGDEGRACGCGGVDHLETYAGKAGIEREARRRAAAGQRSVLIDLAGDSTIKSRHIAKALDADCPVTTDLMNEAVAALARVIGNAVSLLDIDCVVLGGGIVDKLGQPFVEQIAGHPDFGGFGASNVTMKIGQRLDDAGVVGAAVLAADAAGLLD